MDNEVPPLFSLRLKVRRCVQTVLENSRNLKRLKKLTPETVVEASDKMCAAMTQASLLLLEQQKAYETQHYLLTQVTHKRNWRACSDASDALAVKRREVVAAPAPAKPKRGKKKA